MTDRLRIATIAGIAAWIAITVFYGAVVVPTAHDVMGTHRDIGFVTRKVTGPLNALGLVVTALVQTSSREGLEADEPSAVMLRDRSRPQPSVVTAHAKGFGRHVK